MDPVRLVTFDVTNTIIRVAGSVGKQYGHMAKVCLDRTIDPAKLDSAFRDAYKHQVKMYPNFGANSEMTSSKWWTDVVCRTFNDARCDIPREELLQLSDKLYQYFYTKDAWEVLPLAEQTLEMLKSRGLKLGVVSNFDERLQTLLKNIGLEKYFDFVLASSVEKVEKPDKEIFNKALSISGVSANESIHIGDNVFTDYFGAKSAGLQGLLVWSKDKVLPEHVDTKFVLSGIQDILKFI